MLTDYIARQRQEKDILLMTHIVLGYPSFEASYEIVARMVEAGVELMELQIPFSEPIADGPVILQANQEALSAGATVEKSVALAEKLTARFDIPFVFMTYYNILYARKVEPMVAQAAKMNIRGMIVPDLPLEESHAYLRAMQHHDLDPIFIFSPKTSRQRMSALGEHARGFVYCVARKGVTGSDTAFSNDIADYLESCRQATSLPLAVGFGVKEKADVDFLRGKVDVAVIGSESIRRMEKGGVRAVGAFLESLR